MGKVINGAVKQRESFYCDELQWYNESKKWVTRGDQIRMGNDSAQRFLFTDEGLKIYESSPFGIKVGLYG